MLLHRFLADSGSYSEHTEDVSTDEHPLPFALALFGGTRVVGAAEFVGQGHCSAAEDTHGIEAAGGVPSRCYVSQVYRHAWLATPCSSPEKVRPCYCGRHNRRGDVVQVLDRSHHGRDLVLDSGLTGSPDGSARLQW